MNGKLEKLLANPNFIDKIIKLKDIEQVRNYFTNSGYEITDEEIEDLKILLSKIYSEVNKLSDEEKQELKNFSQKNKKEITSLTSEELQQASGGISKGAAIGAGVGALIGAGTVIGEQIVGRKKISSLCNKIWDKCTEPTLLSKKRDGNAEIMYLCTAGLSTFVPLAVGIVGITAVTAGAAAAGGAAGSGVGYLIGNAVDK